MHCLVRTPEIDRLRERFNASYPAEAQTVNQFTALVEAFMTRNGTLTVPTTVTPLATFLRQERQRDAQVEALIRQQQQPQFSREIQSAQQEMQSIKQQAIANGTFMKAPNGNPTNLNEQQWLQVRTRAFKQWFGDWENDPANASKIVDENGEPLVVYHGSGAKFNIFSHEHKGENTGDGYYIDKKTGEHIPIDSVNAFFFSTDKGVALSYIILSNINRWNHLTNISETIADVFIDKQQATTAFNSQTVTISRETVLTAFEELSSINPRFKKLADYIRKNSETGKKLTEREKQEVVTMLHDALKTLRPLTRNMNMSISDHYHHVYQINSIIKKYHNKAGIEALRRGEIPQELKQQWYADKFFHGKEAIDQKNKPYWANFWDEESKSWRDNDDDALIFFESLPENSYDWPTLRYSPQRGLSFQENSRAEKFYFKEHTPQEVEDVLNKMQSLYKYSVKKLNEQAKQGRIFERSEMYAVFLNMRDPLAHDYEGTRQGQGYKNTNHSFGYVAARHVKKALESGNDGVIYQNVSDPYLADNYGVFNPNQIKSATANNGNFSTQDDNIYYSRETAAQQSPADITTQVIDHIQDSGINIRLVDEADIPAEAQANTQVEPIFTTVAPYFYTPLTAENKAEITEAVQKDFWNRATTIAKHLGIKVNNIFTNVGGYAFEEGKLAGQQVHELSYTFELANATPEQADKFACLLGDLGYENQEAVISYNYLNADATNADAFELSIPILDVAAAVKALDAAGIKDFTINENDKSIKLLNFDTSNPDANVEQVTRLINELNKLNAYDTARENETNKIASRYLDRKARRSLYQEWMEADSSGQQEGLRSLYSQAQQYLQQVRAGETVKAGEIRQLRTTTGTVMGWTQHGNIYLTKRGFNPNTPIHEYTHLWDKMVQHLSPKLWRRGVRLMKQTFLWDTIANSEEYGRQWESQGYTGAELEALIASEVHARLVGKDGAQLLEQIAKQKGSEGIIAKLKQWLLDCYKTIAKTLGVWTDDMLADLTLEDFTKMTLRDFAEGINPNQQLYNAGFQTGQNTTQFSQELGQPQAQQAQARAQQQLANPQNSTTFAQNQN